MKKSPTLRQRLANIIGGDPRAREIDRLEKFNELLFRARDYAYSPETLAQKLQEADPQLLALLVRQRGYTTLIGDGAGGGMWSESDRLAAVKDSRYMHHHDVMTARAVSLWVNFGFGQHIVISPTDDVMKEVFHECWTARRNKPIFGQRKIKRLAADSLVDGEFLIIGYFSKLDGRGTFRRIPTDKFSTIVHEEGDSDIPLYYVQNASVKVGERIYSAVWYADWQASAEQLARYHETHPMPVDAINADELRAETRVVAMHIAFNENNGRGWPQLRRTMDWATAYRNFLQDRASVAASVAMFVDKVKMTGSSQTQVSAMVSSLQSTLALSGSPGGDRNPAPAAGSTWVENQLVDRQRLGQSTGAGDGQIDGASILGQFAAGADVPLIWLERPDVAGNFAVARQSVLPWYEVVQSYQADWIDIFSDLVELVGRMWNEYGDGGVEDYAAEVTLDSPFESDIAETASMMNSVTSALAGGALAPDVAQRVNARLVTLGLTAFGVRDAGEIVAPATEQAQLPEAMQRAIVNFVESKITLAQLTAFAELERGENGKRSNEKRRNIKEKPMPNWWGKNGSKNERKETSDAGAF